MFDSIAPRYDLLNRLLSGGMDICWRKALVTRLSPQKGETFLDVATGTGDVALDIFRWNPGKALTIYGVDPSGEMLRRALEKTRQKGVPANQIVLIQGSAEALPFPETRFDGLTVAFGVRNFSNLDLGLRELYRVLKPGGRAVILEFSLPRWNILKWFYQLYFKEVLPRIGGLISGNSGAYRYLPDSVGAFPSRQGLRNHILQAGFKSVVFKDKTFGIVTLYKAIK